MKLSRIVGIVLIAISLFVGYMGVNKISDSTAEIEVFDIELEASDEGGKQTGYIYVGLAVLLLFGGIYSINRK